MLHLGLDIGDVTLRTPMRNAHQHFDVEFNFVLEGGITLHNGQWQAKVSAGEACVFWASCLHRVVRVEDPTRMVWVTVDLPRFVGWGLPDRLTRAVLDGKVVVDPTSAELTGDRSCVARWLQDRERAGRVGVAQGGMALLLSELECRARRMAEADGLRGCQTAKFPRRSGTGLLPLAVERLARSAARAAKQSETVADLAESVGLSPRYATTLFRRHMGMGLSEYLARQRVAEAQRQLTLTRRPVIEIAYDCGFRSVSRFYAWFQRLHTCSPTRYRELAMSEGHG
jgi:methylphosphotriester-DNA--protein-cysteine methyltransferase